MVEKQLMSEENYIYLTEEGLAKINEELEFLKTVRRDEISTKLQIAIAQGDLKENAEYHAAKEEQAKVQHRMNELEQKLRSAQIIDEKNVQAGEIRIGTLYGFSSVIGSYISRRLLFHSWPYRVLLIWANCTPSRSNHG